MGIRMDQWIGLNPRSEKIIVGQPVLLYTDLVRRTHKDGRVELFKPKKTYGTDTKTERIATIAGAFDDVAGHLFRHTLADGTIYEEYLQANPWSSGPMYFVALKDADGNPVPESLWTDEEMDRY